MVCRGINKLQNAKNRNVLASKLRALNMFKGGKCYFTGERVLEGNSDTDGRAIEYFPLTTSVW